MSLHPLHRLWRAFPPARRRRLLARGTAILAPRPDWPPPAALGAVVVGGEIGRASGLGEGARVMLRALATLGVPARGFRAGFALGPEAEELAQPTLTGEQAGEQAVAAWPPAAPLILHVNAPQFAAALLRVGRRRLRGRRIIGYWAWELPSIPEEWRPAAALVHEVWTPSHFTAAALTPLLPGRIRVVPHALAAAPPRPAALTRADFGLPAAAVVVLASFNLASSFVRKNPLAAIAAFREAFGTREDRILLLKVGHPEHAPADWERLRNAAAAPNIRLETRTLPAADSHALTAAADIVLSLHRSEGFGLVPAEAMLLGRAVVATDWSATTEFLDARSGMPVPYRLVPARDPRGVFEAPGAVWAEPDIGAAAVMLRRLADDPALRAQLGAAARVAATHRLGPAPLAGALGEIGFVRQ